MTYVTVCVFLRTQSTETSERDDRPALCSRIITSALTNFAANSRTHAHATSDLESGAQPGRTTRSSGPRCDRADRRRWIEHRPLGAYTYRIGQVFGVADAGSRHVRRRHDPPAPGRARAWWPGEEVRTSAGWCGRAPRTTLARVSGALALTWPGVRAVAPPALQP